MPIRRSHPLPGQATADLLRQVRNVELRTRRLVDSHFSGEYLSTFKGQGIEFAEAREYQPGDDVRSIDWNVTARLGTPFVKRYVEERELSLLLIVDLSASDRWGSRERMKSQLATEVATTLAMSAARNNDRVGLLIATDEVESFIPPRKGRRHVLRLVRDLLACEPRSSATDLSPALTFAQRVLPHRALVFIFSDFQLGGTWDRSAHSLATLRTRHDVVACHLSDPRDVELPPIGMLRVQDPESGARIVLDTGSARLRERFAALVNSETAKARKLLTASGVDIIRLRTDEPYAGALLNFFRRRARRKDR